MADLSIQIKGVGELIRALGALEAFDVLRVPMERAVEILRSDLATYPPPRPGSTYRRTGTLGRRWTTKIDQSPNELRGTVGNNTSYGPYVQSDDQQAWMHRGRWQTDREVIEEDRPDIERLFEDAINAAIP